ncbi:unannotated protein [freshwater metagenome]|uniref:Unannotated protein n=1 Tax=freshwater metagenome TaxID=449393 RepID=A0A6J6IVV2_9ZZZZ
MESLCSRGEREDVNEPRHQPAEAEILRRYVAARPGEDVPEVVLAEHEVVDRQGPQNDSGSGAREHTRSESPFGSTFPHEHRGTTESDNHDRPRSDVGLRRHRSASDERDHPAQRSTRSQSDERRCREQDPRHRDDRIPGLAEVADVELEQPRRENQAPGEPCDRPDSQAQNQQKDTHSDQGKGHRRYLVFGEPATGQDPKQRVPQERRRTRMTPTLARVQAHPLFAAQERTGTEFECGVVAAGNGSIAERTELPDKQHEYRSDDGDGAETGRHVLEDSGPGHRALDG